MIEINLLPGAGKKARGGRSRGPGLGAALAGAAKSIKDPFLLGGVATATLCLLAVGGLWFTQSAQASDLTEREQRAVQDSTRFAAVLAERRAAVMQRDSVVRQINVIKSIDNNRFIWAHVMDEVSRALPAYTWLTSMTQTSAAPTAQSAAPAPTAPAANDSAKGKGSPTRKVAEPASPTMKFRLVGNTVDIQALTRFMKDLEASPFIQNVQLVKTSIVTQDQKEVTEFLLDAEFQSPEPGAIRTVPVSLSVR